MASGPDLSCHKERSNYLRLSRAIIDIGTQVLRDILSQTVPPNTVKNQALSCPGLKLNTSQRKLLNSAVSRGYQEFDISFLYTLIRGLCTNIYPTKGWNPPYPPTQSEVAIGDDVERIHFIRNYVYGHMSETTISDQAFVQHWQEMAGVMDRMDTLYKTQYKLLLTKIESDFMDFETLKLKQKADMVIQQWEKEDELFCTTKASEHVMDIIMSKNFTLITGAPGAGKSAISHHTALQLQDKDYQIVAVDSVEELVGFWMPGLKQVFVLDDVFGVHTVDEQELAIWNKRRNTLKNCLHNNKLIITMRKYLQIDQLLCSFSSHLEYEIVDIGQQDLMLSSEEREKMFKKHMSHNQREASNVIEASNLEYVRNCSIIFFPLMCKIIGADRKSEIDLLSFFRNPIMILKEQINQLKQYSVEKYLGLVLCAVYDNKLSEGLFDVGEESEEIKTKREDFAECCGLDRSISRQKIHSQLQALKCTYVVEDGSNYRFLHDILYDIVVSTFTPVFHKSILKHCSSRFINQRIRFASVSIDEDESVVTVVIDDALQGLWINRLCKDLNDRNYFDVCSNVCLQDITREKLLATELKNNLNLTDEDICALVGDCNVKTEKPDLDIEALAYIKKIIMYFKEAYFYSIDATLLHLVVHNNLGETFLFLWQHICTKNSKQEFFSSVTLLNVAILADNISTTQMLIDECHDIDVGDKLEQISPLCTACLIGDIALTKQILDKGAEINKCNNNGWSPLNVASLTGHDKIIQILTDKDADINTWDSDGCSPLYIASQNGHDKVVQILIDKGADINTCDNNGCSPLYAASRNGHDKVVRILTDKGADINKCDNYGHSPLLMASQYGHDKVVQILTDKNADINKCYNYGWSPLYVALCNGHDKIVQILIDKGADINKCDSEGCSPLYDASCIGYEKVVQILTDKDAVINKCNNGGCSPVYIASQKGHDKVVQILTDKGADINKCNNIGVSPLHIASVNGHDKVVQILTDKGADINKCNNNGCSPLYIASVNGHDKVVQILTDKGADINKCNNNGCSPLYIASVNGHDKVVQILTDKGADINKCDNYGCSPLYAASCTGHDKVVQILTDKGADINKCYNDGHSPLYSASRNGHDKIVQILTDKGADIKQCDNDGCSPLYIAACTGHDKVVQIVIDKGADVNKCNNNGRSPLYIASYNGYDKVVEILTDKGADINKCYNDGHSPLYSASRNGHDKVVQILANKGADINKCNNYGYSPLYIASSNGHDKIVQILADKGADIKQCDNDGCSPLYIAACTGHDKVVQIVIDKGADVNKCNNNGRSPLYIASYNGYDKVVEILTDKGADINKCYNGGCSPLYSASRNGHDKVVQILADKGADINKCNNNGRSPLIAAACTGHDKVVQILTDKGADINKCNNYGCSPLYIASSN